MLYYINKVIYLIYKTKKMTRKTNSKSKSFYNYEVLIKVGDNESVTYYITQEEIFNKYNISYGLVRKFLLDEDFESRKQPFMKIKKIHKARFKLVEV